MSENLHADFTNKVRYAPGCKCLTCTFNRIKILVDNPIIDRLKIFTELDECAKKRRGYEDGDSVIIPEQIATKIELLMAKLDSLQDHEIMAELEILDVTVEFMERQRDIEEARLKSHPYWAKSSNRRKDD